MSSKKTERADREQDHNLNGTFISVLVLGVFIIILWFSFYVFYLHR
ncbi:cytochrome c oxidase subunit 2A [Gottfriedia acidiceleris]|uniref:Cytochrome c oxidase subunit 2A n=1 Tax=Gottfriedia acidiceleris TaxID=371036 RepID=A0ABY4JSG9_9BACI|nr:cytochrome c oxidase subunit 2A [Gottfriedia acidiceleris]UPM56289.1 cytochrome c oxidase subunit 2A [Gottfriedia acidiceleris]